METVEKEAEIFVCGATSQIILHKMILKNILVHTTTQRRSSNDRK